MRVLIRRHEFDPPVPLPRHGCELDLLMLPGEYIVHITIKPRQPYESTPSIESVLIAHPASPPHEPSLDRHTAWDRINGNDD